MSILQPFSLWTRRVLRTLSPGDQVIVGWIPSAFVISPWEHLNSMMRKETTILDVFMAPFSDVVRTPRSGILHSPCVGHRSLILIPVASGSPLPSLFLTSSPP